MFYIDVVSRILHVVTAICLVGGSIFSLAVLLPSLAQLDEPVRKTFAQSVTARWKRFVHVGVLIFLISGFYNFARSVPLHKGDTLYHALVGTKILIALVVFFLASALVGRSEKLSFIRDNRRKWLTITVVLALTIVAISGYLKVRGVTPPMTPPALSGSAIR